MEEVMLGMPGIWADDNREVADHYTTKIGGLPDWPIPIFSVGGDLLQCALCKRILCLLAQIFAPVSSKSLGVEERILYVFGCLEAGCGSKPSSWRVLRVQKSCNTKEVNHLCNGVVPSSSSSSSSLSSLSNPGNDWRENLWCSDSIEVDGASDDDIDLGALSMALSEAAASLTSSRKQIPEPDVVQKPSRIDYTSRTALDKFPALPCFYIYPQEEKISKGNSDVPICDNEIDVDDDHTGEEKWEQESYEYDRALNADRTYLKFKKRLDAYPEQCFRYAYGGKPLLAATLVEEYPGNCRLCGGSRQYEMQLMPTVLYYLQEATSGEKSFSLESWNWMTLIVYTCSKSCVPPRNHGDNLANEGWAVIEETVVIQYDE